MRRLSTIVLVMTWGCGPTVTDLDSGAAGGSADDSATSTGFLPGDDGVPPDPSTTSSSGGVATFGDEGTSGDDGFTFISRDDFGCAPQGDDPEYLAHCTPVECSQWDQDCPRGEKCVPWANNGGSVWNGTRCSPVAEDPAAVGEPCTVEGNAVSGVDNCDFGSMCFYVDSDTLEGTCVEQCTGSPENPECPEAHSCQQNANGDLLVCLPWCNPLADDCDPGFKCLAFSGSAFTCVPSADESGPGEACEFSNSCAPGLTCLDGEAVGCDDVQCCTAFCDLTAGERNPACDLDQVCTPWFEADPPEGYENLGVCLPGGG